MATIRYLVNDVDESLPFYLAIGFQVSQRWGPPFAMLKRDDLTVWLSGPGTSASKPLSDGSQPTPGGWNRLVIEVDDLDAAIASATSVRAKLRADPVAGPGGRQALLADPSGNLVELFQPAD